MNGTKALFGSFEQELQNLERIKSEATESFQKEKEKARVLKQKAESVCDINEYREIFEQVLFSNLFFLNWLN